MQYETCKWFGFVAHEAAQGIELVSVGVNAVKGSKFFIKSY